MNSIVKLGALEVGWESKMPEETPNEPLVRVFLATPDARFDMPSNHARTIAALLLEFADQADAEEANLWKLVATFPVLSPEGHLR